MDILHLLASIYVTYKNIPVIDTLMSFYPGLEVMRNRSHAGLSHDFYYVGNAPYRAVTFYKYHLDYNIGSRIKSAIKNELIKHYKVVWTN
jgi:hypothetical protein